MVHLLYPSDPLKPRRPDEVFAAEVEAVRAAGFSASVFSLEQLQAGEFRATPAVPEGANVLYRGWMMPGNEYGALVEALEQAGAKAFTGLKAYLAAHHLPNWYPSLAEFTPETAVFPANCDLEAELRRLAWPEFFVKDYVKSLKTSMGSRISSPEQASAMAAEMRRFRGTIEGGFCVRRVEEFLPDTERRFFVVNGQAFAAEGEAPAVVRACAARFTSSRFFSMDVVERKDGALRVVEIGDGQVSDLVGWEPARFAGVLAEVLG